MKNRGVKPIAVNSIPGQVEQKLERRAAVWRRRCEGATMTRLACEFGVSIGAIYNYIEEVRKQLREATIDLAALEREQSLALLDTAIEQVMPTSTARSRSRPKSIASLKASRKPSR